MDRPEMVGVIDCPLQRDRRASRAVDTDDNGSVRCLRHDSTLTDRVSQVQRPTSLNEAGWSWMERVVGPWAPNINGATIGS